MSLEESRLSLKKSGKGGDKLFLVFVLILVVFGTAMVFSAGYYSSIQEGGGFLKELGSAAAWAGTGIATMFVVSYIPAKVYYPFAPLMLLAAIVSLILVWSPLGLTLNNANRWLNFGAFTIMPGEIAKICGIFFVAWWFTKYKLAYKKFLKGILPIYVITGALFALIYLQPNLSTALTIAFIFVGMVFVAGAQLRSIFLPAIVAIPALAAMVIMKNGFHMDRFTTFLDPFADETGSGWQVANSLRAIASGGFFGKGLGNSVQKALYLPEVKNDYIFAIIGEELGVLGCLICIALFVCLIWRCIIISINAETRFTFLVSSGITIMIALQVIFNIMVATSLMPPTGVILPFISQGGTATILIMFEMGVMYNISK
jgi:cell division protein FtsW